MIKFVIMNTIDESIFKSYDIRGIYPSQLDEDIAYQLGHAYAELLRSELKQEKIQVVVGRDMRISSPSLHEKLIAGLLDAGIDVVDIGLASTPTFYFAVTEYGYDGGILVSASHNPKEYNGFKLVRAKALPVSKDTGILWLRDRIKQGGFENASERGSREQKNGVLEAEVENALQMSEVEKIKPMKIVADAANSMGALYMDALFEKLPCELAKMNFELDGNFPAHEADPYKLENVEALMKKVVEEKADLGIATDGDGDRIFFIDNKGRQIDPALVRGLISMIMLRKHPGAKICYDIRPGKITGDLILENGGVPCVTRVGHSLIKEQAIEEGAIFAGESSGHFFFQVGQGFYEEPMLMITKLLQEFSESGKSVAEYIEPYDGRYAHSGEINFKVEDKDGVIAGLEAKYADGKISKIDGLTVVFDDFWFNVRASNTEPLLRLNLEAVSNDVMQEKRDEIRAFIESH